MTPRKPAAIAKDLREARSALGMSRAELGQLAGVTRAELDSAERAGTVSLSVLDRIATALGGALEAVLIGERFWEAPALALKTGDFAAAVPALRPKLAQIGAAARTAQQLAALIELPATSEPRDAGLRPREVTGDPAHEGEQLARLTRKALRNLEAPIASVRDVLSHFRVPSFLVDVGSDDIDGAVLFGAIGPPCIAVNVSARRGLTTALRMTLAHELCHALFDRPQASALAIVEHESRRGEAIERRANAFAAHLLAPKAAVRSFLTDQGWTASAGVERAHLSGLSRHFGMGIEAMAAHLVSCGVWPRSEMQKHVGLSSVRFVSNDDLEHVRPTAHERMVSLERRGLVLERAVFAVERGRLSRGRFAAVLGVVQRAHADAILYERGVALPAEHVHGAIS